MSPACRAFRDALDDLSQRAAPGGHDEACAECAAYLARTTRCAEALAALPRRAAPDELQGRVVAALQAGARQERAVRALDALARLGAPNDVERRLEAEVEFTAHLPGLARPARLAAPNVLERLVAEELADPAAALVRRHVGGLTRRGAPPELASLLAQRLSAGPRSPTALRAPEPPLRRARFNPARALSAAAAVLVLLALFSPLRRVPGSLEPDSGPTEGSRPRLRLVAARASDLDPMALQLLDGLGGGILSARGGTDGGQGSSSRGPERDGGGR